MNSSLDSKKTIYPKNALEWREWLEKNHFITDSVWLIQYRKSSKIPSISWDEAVTEALCFGWIDSLKKKLDPERTIQFFSKRKPNSTWSRINKNKIKLLIEAGLMCEAGLKSVEIAKQNGSWIILDDVEELIIPKDLEVAFAHHSNAKTYFLGLSNSNKKMLLQWITLAKRPETRQKRIAEVTEQAGQNLKPKQFQ